MQVRTSTRLVALAAVVSAGAAYGGDTQVGDLRLGNGDALGGVVFDPGFAFTTRGVVDAPVALDSAFVGGSQNANGIIVDPSAGGPTDMKVTTFSGSTDIQNPNRFKTSTDGGLNNANRVGMIQWTLDLNPLDGYLSGNNLNLTALDLDLVMEPVGAFDKEYDIYMSYTNAAEGINRVAIDSTTPGSNIIDPETGNPQIDTDGAGGLNYARFHDHVHNPAGSLPAVGDVVNGEFKLLAKNQLGALVAGVFTEDLLGLYEDGVREVEFMISPHAFWSGNGRRIRIQEGSGLSITTEDAMASLVGDYNGDGFVSQGDLDLVLLNWGDAVVPGGFDEGNLDGGGPFDGLISQNELDGVLLNWGNGTPPAAAVPEPASLALIAIGGLALAGRSGRRD